MEKTSTEQENDEAIEKVKEWVRNEQFGTLLTKTVGFIGICAGISMLLYSMIHYAPIWMHKLISFL